MKIEILGTGCPKCIALFEATKKAVAQKGLFVQIEKVEDIVKIMNYGVMSTPAVVIDGQVKSSGKVLGVQEVLALLENQGEACSLDCGCNPADNKTQEHSEGSCCGVGGSKNSCC